MNYKELFIDKDDILLIRKELVRVLGDLNEAVILNQLHYWIEINKKAEKNFYDDRHWVFNTYQTWKETDFDFWSTDTIRRTLTRLENKGIILTANYNKLKIDKTKWYTIDYEKLQKMIDEYEEKQNAIKETADCGHDIANCIVGNGSIIKAIPENTNKDYNINSKANSFFEKKVRENKKTVNQDDFINHIHNVVKKLEEEVFGEDQAGNVEQFFKYFIEQYAKTFGKRHPFLKEETLYGLAANITNHIYIDRGEFDTHFEPLVSDAPEDNSYESAVDLYFKTEFKEKCDYSMVHFCQENVLTKLMGHDTSHQWFTNES